MNNGYLIHSLVIVLLSYFFNLKVTLVGNRPCGEIAEEKITAMKALLVPVLEEIVGKKMKYRSSSTDCNIPLSLGIPALCIGVSNHGGAHTREEWVEKASLIPGLEVGIRTALVAGGLK